MSPSRPFLGALVLLASSALAQEPYQRAGLQAELSTLWFGTEGTVTIVDRDTVRVDGFSYNGGGILVQFYLSETTENPKVKQGLPVGPQLEGQVWNDGTIVMDLPAGETMDDYHAITLFCEVAKVHFGTGVFEPPVPETYCEPSTDTVGCAPSVHAPAAPSVGGEEPALVIATRVANRAVGQLVYGFGRTSIPYQGGTLCVSGPEGRSPLLHSGGEPEGFDCSGSFVFDMAAHVRSGTDPRLVPGEVVFAQFVYRDPLDRLGVGTTDAVRLLVAP